MTNPILCIYRPDDLDSFAAAWCAHQLVELAGTPVEYVATREDKHNWGPILGPSPREEGGACLKCGAFATSEGDLPCLPADFSPGRVPLAGRDILILGVPYPLPILRAMAAEARSVLVVGREIGALRGLPEPIYVAHLSSFRRWLDVAPSHPSRIAVIAEKDHSLAGLAWDGLSGGQPRPPIVELVEDRALGRAAREPDASRFAAVAESWGLEVTAENLARYDKWERQAQQAWPPGMITDDFRGEAWGNLLQEGEAILRDRRRLVASILRERRTMRIGGHVVPVVNCPAALAADVGNLLCQETNDRDGAIFWRRRNEGPFPHKNGCYPLFAATYHDGADGLWHFTLTSPEGGADCASVANSVADSLNAAMHEPHDQREARDDYIHYWHHGREWTSAGDARRATFDAPLGWESE
ncbi:MAG: hypothetical protein KGO96_10280 [Elusimicrobia bacterium]|nr:hypothetical protein [Elusimicrobiota bacterium]